MIQTSEKISPGTVRTHLVKASREDLELMVVELLEMLEEAGFDIVLLERDLPS
jgi:hypothetical protein